MDGDAIGLSGDIPACLLHGGYAAALARLSAKLFDLAENLLDVQGFSPSIRLFNMRAYGGTPPLYISP